MKPAFAVVGHPNKGKSSIVATLSRDDGIEISPASGTTQRAERVEVSAGSHSYMLIDTPGFQRPTKVLKWLDSHAPNAADRRAAVEQFLLDRACQQQFPDEIELLTPIMEGAAILYVVDGSRPYGPEYEAEMEVLRWTGQPSMGLINTIENDSHLEAWKQALSQYFKVVRTFNPLQADFEKQLAVLDTFSHLQEEWKTEIDALLAAMKQERLGRIDQSIAVLETLLVDLCHYTETQTVLDRRQADALQPVLEARYYQQMKEKENKAIDSLKAIYRYHNLRSRVFELPLENNLFNTEKWIIWGLNRKQLLAAASFAGAAAGAVVDATLAGNSLLLGALGGSILGAGGAWFGADKLAEFRINGLPVGGFEARQGPIRNRNFPYVVLGRFLYIERLLRSRNHARQDDLNLDESDLAETLQMLNASEQRAIHAALDRLRQQKSVGNLAEILRPLFVTD